MVFVTRLVSRWMVWMGTDEVHENVIADVGGNVDDGC